jgi:hypothetical protein
MRQSRKPQPEHGIFRVIGSASVLICDGDAGRWNGCAACVKDGTVDISEDGLSDSEWSGGCEQQQKEQEKPELNHWRTLSGLKQRAVFLVWKAYQLTRTARDYTRLQHVRRHGT